ncbi:hypothetical protein FHG87_004911 [Trinorchestia longiramus]|nr:hypothetical protein FHG87_004911 [Trinorchestia longiramus]
MAPMTVCNRSFVSLDGGGGLLGGTCLSSGPSSEGVPGGEAGLDGGRDGGRDGGLGGTAGEEGRRGGGGLAGEAGRGGTDGEGGRGGCEGDAGLGGLESSPNIFPPKSLLFGRAEPNRSISVVVVAAAAISLLNTLFEGGCGSISPKGLMSAA